MGSKTPDGHGRGPNGMQRAYMIEPRFQHVEQARQQTLRLPSLIRPGQLQQADWFRVPSKGRMRMEMKTMMMIESEMT
jgi:hypothetical protein